MWKGGGEIISLCPQVSVGTVLVNE